ncbi:MAG: hypothetical protein KAX49_19645 [Halanaerobiales bacterium]|nr:hypothetical protein [Halanaerobiales bacterium]
MESMFELTPEKYYEEAKKMLKKKDLIGFMENIGSGKVLAENNKDLLAEITFLKVKGLYSFNQHKKALESISEALKYNTGTEVLRLKNYEGVIYGYLGRLNKAKKIFKELITEIQETEFLIEIYLNIAWVYLTLDKNNSKEHNVEEAKGYLELTKKHFDSLSNKLKWKILNNYSVYYFYKEEYEKAIEMLEDSIKVCEEKDLPDVYNNLAELYLKTSNEDDGVPEVVNEYLKKAEILATTYNNKLALGYIFYTTAMIELREDQFKAFEALYLSFENFKKAEATVQACDCLMKINELMDEYKHNSLKSLRENLKNKLKDTPYYDKF